MLLIDAVYIHESGGRTLLHYFIKELVKRYQSFKILFDDRIDSDIYRELLPRQYLLCKSSEKYRLKFYKEITGEITTIFCFANVPPPIYVKGAEVYILFHNVLMVSGFWEKNGYSMVDKIKFLFKKWYILNKNKKTYTWIVQTGLMQNRLSDSLKISLNSVKVFPFYENNILVPENTNRSRNRQFLYVADGVPQKNHNALLDAWERLFLFYQISPELHLTLHPKFNTLLKKIKDLNAKGLKIINHGICNSERLASLYNQSKYFIYPSLAESFGLPLIEASERGCVIIASDLPFVNEVVKPDATFHPNSPINIAEIVSCCYSNNFTGSNKILVPNEINSIINLLIE